VAPVLAVPAPAGTMGTGASRSIEEDILRGCSVDILAKSWINGHGTSANNDDVFGGAKICPSNFISGLSIWWVPEFWVATVGSCRMSRPTALAEHVQGLRGAAP